MRRVSLAGSGKSLSIERTARGDLLRRKWFKATLRRITLPVLVILTRFAIALCVFSFCFMTHLSIFISKLIFRSHEQILHRRRREAFVQSTSPLRDDYSISRIGWAIGILALRYSS